MKFKVSFFLILTLVFVGGASKKYFFSPPIPFAYDEPDYVANSMLLDEFNWGIKTDPVFWSQRWAYDQPHLYHYLAGLFLESRYDKPIDVVLKENQLNQRFFYGSPSIVFGKDGDGKTMSDPEIDDYKLAYKVVLVARDLSFYFYLAGGLVLLSIVYFFCHPLLAVLVSIFYLNDYFYDVSILAQADGLLILLILVNILLSLVYIGFAKYRLLVALLMGVACGLALSTKLNGGLALISSMLSIITVFLYKRKTSSYANLLHLPVVIGLAFAFFYWLNPYLYSDPILKISEMFEYRIAMASNSMLIFPNERLPTGLVSKTVFILKNLYQQTGQAVIFSLILSLLSTIGSFLLLVLISIKKVFVKPSSLFLLASSTYSFFIILVYIPMDWGRYYYPAIIQNLLMTTSVINLMVRFMVAKKVK